MSGSSNKFNGSSNSEGSKVKGNRLSQRITNFIENKNGNGAPRFTNAQETNQNNNSYLRSMSPVEVDYPGTNNAARSLTPTHQFTSNNNTRNIAVEDPYTNSAVHFTMMDPTNNKRFNNTQHSESVGRGSYDTRPTSPMSSASNNRPHRQPQQQDYPLQTMSSVVSSQHDEDHFRFDPSLESYDYMGEPKSKSTKDIYYSQTPGGRI